MIISEESIETRPRDTSLAYIKADNHKLQSNSFERQKFSWSLRIAKLKLDKIFFDDVIVTESRSLTF